MRTLTILIVLVLITAGVGLYVVFSGSYDVTAIHPHGSLIAWAAGTAVDNLVRRHAKGIMVPPLGSTSQIATGFLHYNEMCVTCHGAPGILHLEIGEGLYPPPPDLQAAIKELDSRRTLLDFEDRLQRHGNAGFWPYALRSGTVGDDRIRTPFADYERRAI